MALAGFLHRALALAKAAAGSTNRPRPFSGLFLASASPSAAGHLGITRATANPALRDLLTPGAFLLDATHALGAVALRQRPSALSNCLFRDVLYPAALANSKEEAQDDAGDVYALRVLKPLIDAEDGRFQEALDDLARIAADRPDRLTARVCAAAVCDLLGRADEADRWLHGIPDDQCPRESNDFRVGLLSAALGGAPGAIAGSRGRVASAAFQIINERVSDGQMSAFEIIIAGLLKHAAKRRCEDLPLKHGDGFLRALADAITHRGGAPKDDRTIFYVLKASQAVLSAAVLRAHPLSAERISTALRVTESDLARALEEGDAAAAADLRLLHAFLAARVGRFDVALARYQEVAQSNPSDPRPLFLAASICGILGQPADKWQASYMRLAPGLSSHDHATLKSLTEELAVALALSSPHAFDVSCPLRMTFILRAAGSRVDAALVSALRSKNMSVAEWMEVRAVRAFLYAGMWSTLKEYEGSGTGTPAN